MIEEAQLVEEGGEEVPQLEEYLPQGENVEQPVIHLPKEVQNQIAATVMQGRMAGLSEEEIKERVKKQYDLTDEEAELTLQMIMKYLDKNQKQEYELKKTALGMMPALAETMAQSNNPLTPLIMQRLIEMAGFKEESGDDFVKDIMKAKKEIMKAKLISEALKEDEGRKGNSFEALMLEMIRQMEKEKAEAQKMLYQLLLEEKSRKNSESDEALKEVLVQFIDAIDKRLEMMLDMIQNQNAGTGEVQRHRDPLEELLEHQQKLNSLLETLEQAGLVKRKDEDPSRLIEAQLKLKEFELKQKEVEAKQIFYSKLAEALSNPQTLQIIFSGLGQLFGGLLGRTPSPQAFSNALNQVGPAQTPAQVPIAEPQPPDDIPSLEEFVEQAGGGNGE